MTDEEKITPEVRALIRNKLASKEHRAELLRAALHYAKKLHWKVFPVKGGTKDRPLFKEYQFKATTDLEQIKQWWTKWPDANIGILTGEELFCVDVDVRHDGPETIRDLYSKHGRVDTLQQETGRQDHSYHMIFRNPPGNIPGNQKVLGPGVDTRGFHNYFLAEPSIHPNTGLEYRWDNMKHIHQVPILDMPKWMLDAILNHHKNGRKQYPMSDQVKEGVQHYTLLNILVDMRKVGATEAMLRGAVREANEHNLSDPDKNLDRLNKLVDWVVKTIQPYHQGPVPEPPGDIWKPQKGAKPNVQKLVLPEPLTANDILDSAIDLPGELIENLLPRKGVALLIGAHRSGKTIFAAQIVLALLRNQNLLDYYQLKAHGPVIVFEKDDPDGTASFLDIFLKSGVPRDLALRFFPKQRIPDEIPLGPAFCEWIEKEVQKTSSPLVVLDSYTSLRGERKSGGDIAKLENREIGQLDELAKRLGCLIILIHHESITTRSNGSLDWDARGAGSYGITAASECQILVSRYRELAIGATERLLRFRSRHLKEHQVTLAYNAKTGLYDYVIAGEAARFYPAIRQIRLNQVGKEATLAATFTAQDLEEPLGILRSAAFKEASLMLNAGVLWRVEKKEEKKPKEPKKEKEEKRARYYELAPDLQKLKVLW